MQLLRFVLRLDILQKPFLHFVGRTSLQLNDRGNPNSGYLANIKKSYLLDMPFQVKSVQVEKLLSSEQVSVL